MKRAAFDGLYRQHYPRVLGLCRRLLGSPDDAEDAAQEVFLRGYRAFGRYRPEDSFAAWINTIASNHCIDLLRRRRRLPDFAADAEGDLDALAGSEPDGAMSMIAASEAERVASAVDALPEKFRLPIVLAYYADAGYGEIAESLGVTRNHVGVLLLRARRRLRSALQAEQQCRT